MKILVTGGAGFIGSNVADAYIEAGHEVAVIDNLCTGVREYLNPHAKFFEVDIEDVEAVERVIDEFKPEVINHHAAQVDVRKAVADPRWDARRNIIGSLNLIETALNTGVKKFIYANSGGAGYGDPKPEDIPCRESTPIAPISPYGVSKMTVERYLYARQATHHLPYVALRYGNVYGPRQTFGEAGVCSIFANIMLKGDQPIIYGDGSQERDYCFIKDVVSANVKALTDKAAGAYNVGTGEGISTQRVFDAVKQAVGYLGEPKYEPERTGEVQRIILDATRLRTELDWQPSVAFEEGVEETVRWMRTQV